MCGRACAAGERWWAEKRAGRWWGIWFAVGETVAVDGR